MLARFLLASSIVLGLVLLAEPGEAAPKVVLEGVVNINTASPDELQLLPGVGPAKVRNIVAYRTKHPFRTVEELVRIKGIGRKMFRRLRLHLAIAGPTTAQRVIRAEPPPAVAPMEPPVLLRRLVPTLPPRAAPVLWRKPIPRPRPSPPPFPTARGDHCQRGP